MFLVMVEPWAIQIKILKWDSVHCFWTYLSSVAVCGPTESVVAYESTPKLGGFNRHSRNLHGGWAQRRASSAARGVSWASPPSWYLPHTSGPSTDMAGASLASLSLGSLSSSGGQNSFRAAQASVGNTPGEQTLTHKHVSSLCLLHTPDIPLATQVTWPRPAPRWRGSGVSTGSLL